MYELKGESEQGVQSIKIVEGCQKKPILIEGVIVYLHRGMGRSRPASSRGGAK
jgi:hypothetical protein